MNKAEMADRLAARTGMNEVAAKDAVDRVFRDDRRGSCKWRRSADRGNRNPRHQEPAGPHRPQPADRRGDLRIGVEITFVQGREDTQGRSERRREAVASD